MNATVKNKILDFYAAHKSDVDSLAGYLGVPPLWLVVVWHRESALNPLAQNGNTNAAGLNQMMPATLAGLNSSTSAFLNGGVSYQINLMRQFFKPVRGKIKRAGDLYAFNFFPAAIIKNFDADYPIGKDEDFSTFYGVSKNKIYDQNSGLDFDKDKQLTRRDMWNEIETKYDELVKVDFFFRDLWIDFKTNWLAWVIALAMAVVAIIIVVNR